MSARPPLELLKEDERRARVRLGAYRARLYRHDGASPISVQRRLHELERRWINAVERLREAQHEHKR